MIHGKHYFPNTNREIIITDESTIFVIIENSAIISGNKRDLKAELFDQYCVRKKVSNLHQLYELYSFLSLENWDMPIIYTLFKENIE